MGLWVIHKIILLANKLWISRVDLNRPPLSTQNGGFVLSLSPKKFCLNRAGVVWYLRMIMKVFCSGCLICRKNLNVCKRNDACVIAILMQSEEIMRALQKPTGENIVQLWINNAFYGGKVRILLRHCNNNFSALECASVCLQYSLFQRKL